MSSEYMRVAAFAASDEQRLEPAIDLVAGVPEIFADIAILKVFGGMARVTLARLTDPVRVTYEQCGTLLMPARAFLRSHAMARLTVDMPPDLDRH